MQHPYYDGVYGTSVTRHRIRLGYREEWRAHNFVFWNNIYVNGVPESLPTESVNLNEYEGDLVKKLAAVVIYATVAPFGGELDAYHYIADNEDLQFVGDIADIDYPEHVLYTYDTVSAIQDPITKKWIYTFNNLTQVYPAKSLPLY